MAARRRRRAGAARWRFRSTAGARGRGGGRLRAARPRSPPGRAAGRARDDSLIAPSRRPLVALTAPVAGIEADLACRCSISLGEQGFDVGRARSPRRTGCARPRRRRRPRRPPAIRCGRAARRDRAGSRARRPTANARPRSRGGATGGQGRRGRSRIAANARRSLDCCSRDDRTLLRPTAPPSAAPLRARRRAVAAASGGAAPPGRGRSRPARAR